MSNKDDPTEALQRKIEAHRHAVRFANNLTVFMREVLNLDETNVRLRERVVRDEDAMGLMALWLQVRRSTKQQDE